MRPSRPKEQALAAARERAGTLRLRPARPPAHRRHRSGRRKSRSAKGARRGRRQTSGTVRVFGAAERVWIYSRAVTDWLGAAPLGSPSLDRRYSTASLMFGQRKLLYLRLLKKLVRASARPVFSRARMVTALSSRVGSEPADRNRPDLRSVGRKAHTRRLKNRSSRPG